MQYPGTRLKQNAILYAKNHNAVFILSLHAITNGANNGTNTFFERLEQMINMILHNNMRMYLLSELPDCKFVLLQVLPIILRSH